MGSSTPSNCLVGRCALSEVLADQMNGVVDWLSVVRIYLEAVIANEYEVE